MHQEMQQEKAIASQWFETLRNQICTKFESIEAAYTQGVFADQPAAKFTFTPTKRHSETGEESGGGVMGVLRGGRVFEKVGVNISTVFGTLTPKAQTAMAARGVQGIAEKPQFWASGISLVAHLNSPKTPAVHMNTRMFWTPEQWWFGGGGDLNPALPVAQETAHFHKCYQAACDAHDSEYYTRFKAWADSYFFIRHRGFARGVGGIFYDDLNTGDWQADFAFTKAVGEAFLPAYAPLVEQNMHQSWTPEEREALLIRRGYYAEFNLLYDRGTKFGLETGHNVEAVLMSMPPHAKWI